VCGILTLIIPNGKSNISKFVKYASVLAFLCMTVTPLINSTDMLTEIIPDISSITEKSDDTETGIAEHSEKYGSLELVSSEICKAAAKSASEHFGVPKENFYIKLIIDNTETKYSIREVTVYPKGEAANISHSTIKKYFKDIFNTHIEVISNGN